MSYRTGKHGKVYNTNNWDHYHINGKGSHAPLETPEERQKRLKDYHESKGHTDIKMTDSYNQVDRMSDERLHAYIKDTEKHAKTTPDGYTDDYVIHLKRKLRHRFDNT